MKTVEIIFRTIPACQIVHFPEYVQHLKTPSPLSNLLHCRIESGKKPHPSSDSFKTALLLESGHLLGTVCDGSGQTTCSSTPPGQGDGDLAEKKCPKQFAVHHGEPQSIRRVHFEAFMVSLVLLKGQNEILFSHPEQTALYSINEMGGWNWLFGPVRPNSALLFTESQPVFTFFCRLN